LNEPSKNEADLIKKKISSIYDDVLSRYDARKYPEDPYDQARVEFSSRGNNNNQIENAMKWKWGHWGKDNYPQRHKDLIEEIRNIWPKYIQANCTTPEDTFIYWKGALEKRTRYISVAFITHLIHSELVPIIDQHNYRAMNHLLRISEEKVITNKKKPSNWEDIQNLREFLSFISKLLGKEIREVDKFLMMYGRYCAPR